MSNTLLSILVTLFAGLNVFQFIFIRITKRKYAAEAAKAEAEAGQLQTDLHQDQYDYVNEQLSKIQKEYYDLAARYRETMTQHLMEIDVKCNEIAELKSKLVYFKGLRCYCSDCDRRVKDSPYKKDEITKPYKKEETTKQ